MGHEIPVFRKRPEARWQDVKYRRIDFSHPDIDRYCATLRQAYTNGSVDYAAFEAIDPDEFLSAYHCDFCDSRVPLTCFLESNVVAEALLLQPEGFDTGAGGLSEPRVTVTSKGGCEFEGLTADILLGGGAYGGPTPSVNDAKTLATRFVSGLRTLAPDRPWWPRHVVGPWSGYFNDVAWDHTFAVQFIYDARWFVLCATDTD